MNDSLIEDEDSLLVRSSLLSDLCKVDQFEDAMQRLILQHYETIKGWTQRYPFLVQNDREDALHDLFLALRSKLRSNTAQRRLQGFREQSDGDGKQQFSRWIRRVAKNTAIDFVRRQRRRGCTMPEDWEQIVAEEIDLLLWSDYEIVVGQIRSRVVGADVGRAGSVSSLDWDIYCERIKDSVPSAAERFSKSIGAVHQAVYRVRRALEPLREELLASYGFLGDVLLAPRIDDSEVR